MTTPGELPEMAFASEGPVPDAVRADAESMVEKLAGMSPRPVIYARVRARVDDERDAEDQAIVQGTLDVSGTIVRAQAAAGMPGPAMTILENRLERRLNRLAGAREDSDKRPPSSPEGTWRRGDLPTERPGYYQRPREERRVVRKKTYAPDEEVSVEEAIFDLDVLDHRFFLFTDAADGKSSIVYEDGDGVTLRKADGSRPDESGTRVSIDVNETPAPSIGVEDAIERLNVSEAPFIFFRDNNAGAPGVLYRRYDGHYGLVVPAAG